MITDLRTKRTFLRVFTYKMAAKINLHRCGTKLRHCHPMYLLHVVEIFVK